MRTVISVELTGNLTEYRTAAGQTAEVIFELSTCSLTSSRSVRRIALASLARASETMAG